MNGLPWQTLATRKSDGSRLTKASGDYVKEVKIKDKYAVDGERIFRRAPSIIVPKSYDNDI